MYSDIGWSTVIASVVSRMHVCIVSIHWVIQLKKNSVFRDRFQWKYVAEVRRYSSFNKIVIYYSFLFSGFPATQSVRRKRRVHIYAYFIYSRNWNEKYPISIQVKWK